MKTNKIETLFLKDGIIYDDKTSVSIYPKIETDEVISNITNSVIKSSFHIKTGILEVNSCGTFLKSNTININPLNVKTYSDDVLNDLNLYQTSIEITDPTDVANLTSVYLQKTTISDSPENLLILKISDGFESKIEFINDDLFSLEPDQEINPTKITILLKKVISDKDKIKSLLIISLKHNDTDIEKQSDSYRMLFDYTLNNDIIKEFKHFQSENYTIEFNDKDKGYVVLDNGSVVELNNTPESLFGYTKTTTTTNTPQEYKNIYFPIAQIETTIQNQSSAYDFTPSEFQALLFSGLNTNKLTLLKDQKTIDFVSVGTKEINFTFNASVKSKHINDSSSKVTNINLGIPTNSSYLDTSADITDQLVRTGIFSTTPSKVSLKQNMKSLTEISNTIDTYNVRRSEFIYPIYYPTNSYASYTPPVDATMSVITNVSAAATITNKITTISEADLTNWCSLLGITSSASIANVSFTLNNNKVKTYIYQKFEPKITKLNLTTIHRTINSILTSKKIIMNTDSINYEMFIFDNTISVPTSIDNTSNVVKYTATTKTKSLPAALPLENVSLRDYSITDNNHFLKFYNTILNNSIAPNSMIPDTIGQSGDVIFDNTKSTLITDGITFSFDITTGQLIKPTIPNSFYEE